MLFRYRSRNTETQSRSSDVAYRICGIAAPCHCGPVALRPRGIMAPWHCGLYPRSEPFGTEMSKHRFQEFCEKVRSRGQAVRQDTELEELVGHSKPKHLFVPTSLCAHVSLCPRLFVPTSLYAQKVVFCAHVSLCPKKWYFVSSSLCAHVSLCPRLYMPKPMPVGVVGTFPK